MKRKIVSIALVASLLAAGTAQGQQLRTTTDSLSYYMGADVGRMLKGTMDNLQMELQVDAFATALEAVLDGRGPDQDESTAFLEEYFTVRMPAEKLRASEAWLAEVERTVPGVQRTESGLLYQIVDLGDLRLLGTISDEDQVTVHYEGKLQDGTVIDSSRERGEPMTFGLKQIIPGWAEGVKLVGKGGTVRLWLHPDLAYGASGQGRMIAPNAALYFEVELLDVIQAAEQEIITMLPDDDHAQFEKSAREKNLRASEAWLEQIEQTTPGIQRTGSGLLYRIVKPGSSRKRARTDADRLEMYFTGSLPDGTVAFDYSRERGETATYALDGVIDGCTEGLKLVGKRGRIQLRLHPDLAYGTWGYSEHGVSPNEGLFYDVEIVDVFPAGKKLRKK